MNRAQRRASHYKRAQRRGQYQPPQELDPLRLLDRCRPYADGDTTVEHLKTRAAYERLLDGTASTDDFDRVGMALNIAKVRAIAIDETLADLIERAQDAMNACAARYDTRGRFGFDGPGLQVMAAAMEAHEAITDASSPQQMVQALREVVKQIEGAVR
ncbi:hypothetical protein [uncultured Xylophilus sp.]|uniref:hypothetical protein n=1 Tax=uncultured Xylophilus sp. TaxID=296832 RepID=UPI0025F4BA11|nr:hypothetical protein [uncultured Xylophilus sp.]